MLTTQYFEITLNENVSPTSNLEETESIANRLFEAGCDDQVMSTAGPIVSLSFHREAESLGQAIDSAMANIRTAGYTPLRLIVEETLTPTV